MSWYSASKSSSTSPLHALLDLIVEVHGHTSSHAGDTTDGDLVGNASPITFAASTTDVGDGTFASSGGEISVSLDSIVISKSDFTLWLIAGMAGTGGSAGGGAAATAGVSGASDVGVTSVNSVGEVVNFVGDVSSLSLESVGISLVRGHFERRGRFEGRTTSGLWLIADGEATLRVGAGGGGCPFRN